MATPRRIRTSSSSLRVRSQLARSGPVIGVSCCLLAFLLAGCGSSRPWYQDSKAKPRLAELELHHEALPYELDDEMRTWLHDRVTRRGQQIDRVRRLVDVLLGPEGLGVTYQREPTGTARDVFDSGVANCLSFTHLFVGMAREVGLPVYFLEVRDLDNYDREGDLVVHSDHIAVGLGPSHDLTIIDFSTDSPSYRRVRAISDREAVALFYSNRGAERLRNGLHAQALEWLEDAVSIAPEIPGPWINLGVARRRAGDRDAAERAYRHALSIDPTESAAYQNLAALLRMEGEVEEAMELMQLTTRSDQRNPYAFVALGDLSLRHGRSEEAERFYRRAIRVQGDHAEPLAAMGLLEVRRGDHKAARRLLKRASKLDAEDPRVRLLRERLGNSS